MNSMVSVGNCKDCGSQFALTSTARTLDVARGLSEPERCPKCRKINATAIQERGAAYWPAPVETDDTRRCWGKYGLAKLVREHPIREHLPDLSVPSELPLLYLKNPASVEQRAASGQISQADLWAARKFATISEPALRLVKNLEDPKGARVSVLVGPTGTGKSTWVPYAILRSKIGQQGRICVTQPRLITLRRAKDAVDDTTTPGFIARHLLRSITKDGTAGVGAGYEIGFQHSGEYDQQDRYTKLLFVTDGTLISWLESGRIGQFDVVMIDEAHEQSSNMEMIFALLKYRMSLYPRLRVVIASATIDIDKFRAYFGNGRADSVFLAAPAAAASTTPFDVHERWLEEWSTQIQEMPDLSSAREPRARARLLPSAVASVVRAICTQRGFTKQGHQDGDMIVFAPTIASVELIRDEIQAMATRERLGLDVLVSHAQVSQKDLSKFKKSESAAEKAARLGQATSPQRVIVATNYAETSVTVANLRFVIDSGLILEPSWDAKTCSNRFEPQWHSQAGCTQRKGRVGRIQVGECFRLYTQAEFQNLQPQTPPEITRQPLDSFLLSAKAAGIEDLSTFQWLGRASSTDAIREQQEFEFKRAQQAVIRRGSLDAEGDITGRGLELGAMRVDRIELAECFSFADSFACGLEVATFLSFTNQPRSPFRRGHDGLLAYGRWRAGCYDDLEFYLRLYHHWSGMSRGATSKELDAWTEQEGVNPDFMENVSRQRNEHLRQFSRRAHTDPTERELDLRRLHRVRLVLARCLSEWVYRRVENESRVFEPWSKHCPCPLVVEIERESACVGSSHLDAFVCVERMSTSSGRLLARHIIRINPNWLTAFESARPLGLALLLKRTVDDEAEIAARSARAVTNRPVYSATSFQLQQSIRKFRALRDDPESDLFLAEDVELGTPVLLKTANDQVDPGQIVRAMVVKVDAAHGRCEVNQDSFLAWYRENAATPHAPLQCVVRKILADERTNEPYALLLEVEPGVRVRLHRDDMDWATSRLLPTMKPEQLIEIRIKRMVSDVNIDAITLQAFDGRRHLLKLGDEVDATIINKIERSSHGIGLELFPGVRGFLPRERMSFALWYSLIPDKCVGTNLRVIVERMGAAKDLDVISHLVAQKDVLEASRHVIREGEHFPGVITGFYPSPEDREAAFVEFLAGRQGFLPIIFFGSKVTRQIRMKALHVGQVINVTIDRVKRDNKYDLRINFPDLAQIQIGKRYQGIVARFLRGQYGHARAGAFVEIFPGIEGLLHHSKLSSTELSRLNEGDVLDVVVRRVDRNSTPVRIELSL